MVIKLFLAAIWFIPLCTVPLRSQELFDALRLSGRGGTFNAAALGVGNAYSTTGADYSGVRLNPATLGLVRDASAAWSVSTSYFPRPSAPGVSTGQLFSASSTSFSQTGLTIPFGPDSAGFVLAAGFTQSRDYNASLAYNALNTSPTSYVQMLAALNSPFMRNLGLSYQTFDPAGAYAGDSTVIRGNLQQSGTVADQGGLVHVSLGFSYHAMPDMLVGASFSYATGNYLSDRQYNEIDTLDAYGSSVQTDPADPLTTDFRQMSVHDVRNSQYSGWDVRLGMLYSISDELGVSAALKIPFHHRVTELTSLSGYADYEGGRRVEVPEMRSEQRFSVVIPFEATVGAMADMGIVRIGIEGTFIDYSSIDFPGGLSQPASSIAKSQAADLRAVVNLNAGTEVRLPVDGLVARAGFIYQPSPFNGDSPAFAMKTVTFGAGLIVLERLQLDLAYAIGFGTRRGNQYGLDLITQDAVTHDLLFSMKFGF